MHKLAAIGDSLTMGFSSGAIYKTQFSYPAMIARALRAQDSFRAPEFDIDKGATGGFPLNLETLLRMLQKHYPHGLSPVRFVGSLWTINWFMHSVEKFWERGHWFHPEAQPFNNLAVLSYTVQEAYRLSADLCAKEIAHPKNQFFLFDQVPEFPLYRAALATLATKQSRVTALSRLEQLSADGGVENLIVAIGANNCLGAIIDLSIKFSEEADLYRQPHERKCNLWLPRHFEACFVELARRIRLLSVKNVFVSTVPHVTIPPVTRGTPPQHTHKYYEYYTRPWIWDHTFDPAIHPYLTGNDMMLLDEFVDCYNESIRRVARDNGWHVVDFCAFLDSLAYRRQHGEVSYRWPSGALAALAKDGRTSYLVQGNAATLDTRYIELDKKEKIKHGGLFGLDGVHPTTIMYGLVADVFLETMKAQSVTRVDGSAPAMDWDYAVSNDSLITSPPLMLKDLRKVLKLLSGRLYGKILFSVLEKLRGNVS
jgi:hypothetical protein